MTRIGLSIHSQLTLILISTVMQPSLSIGQSVVKRSVTIPVEFQSGMSRGRWDHGYWVNYSRATNPGDIPYVWTFDRDGRPSCSKTDLSFPDAYDVRLRSVAVGDGGAVFASAEVWNKDAAMATVLFRVQPPGVLTDVVRTDSFVAQAMAVSGKGELWMFGASPIKEDRERDFRALERYSLSSLGLDGTRSAPQRTGDPLRMPVAKPVGADLPKSFFNIKGAFSPAANLGYGFPWIVMSSTRVGILSSYPVLWVEMDHSGRVLHRLPVTFHDETDIGRPIPLTVTQGAWQIAEMVMTADNRVFIWATRTPPVQANASGGATTQSSKPDFGLFYLDRSLQRWMRVPRSSLPTGSGGLFGLDGNELILRRGCCTYGWVDAPVN